MGSLSSSCVQNLPTSRKATHAPLAMRAKLALHRVNQTGLSIAVSAMLWHATSPDSSQHRGLRNGERSIRRFRRLPMESGPAQLRRVLSTCVNPACGQSLLL